MNLPKEHPVDNSNLINITLQMMDKASPYYQVVICFYLEQAVTRLQAKFRQSRISTDGKIDPKKFLNLSDKMQITYMQSMLHQFKRLKEPPLDDTFKHEIVHKVKTHDYHEIDFKHPDFVRHLFAALRLPDGLSLNEFMTAKLLYESLLFFNKGQMPTEPKLAFKRFLLSDPNGPYQASTISYWTELESQELVAELQSNENKLKNHYYTINLLPHQMAILLYQMLQLVPWEDLDPCLREKFLAYIRSKSSPEGDLLLIQLNNIPYRKPSFIQQYRGEQGFFMTVEITTGTDIKNQLLKFIEKNEPDLVLFFKRSKPIDPNIGEALGISKRQFLQEYEGMELLANILLVSSQHPGLCLSPDHNPSDPHSPLFSMVLLTLDTLETLQHIAHKTEMVRPLPIVGKISPRAIRAMDDIPAAKKHHSPTFTKAQQMLKTQYPLSDLLSEPHRATEISHPDATRASAIHGSQNYHDFIAQWHDAFLHAWRCGENYKGLIRLLRELLDDKMGLAIDHSGMSIALWKLSDMDFSFGQDLRSAKSDAERTEIALLSNLVMFEKAGCDFRKKLDENYLILYSMVISPERWKPFLQGFSPFNLPYHADYDDLIKGLKSVRHYVHEHPNTTIIDLILDEILNHQSILYDRSSTAPTEKSIEKTRIKMKQYQVNHAYVYVVDKQTQTYDFLDITQDSVKSIYNDIEKEALRDYDEDFWASDARKWSGLSLPLVPEQINLNRIINQSLQTQLEHMDLNSVFYWSKNKGIYFKKTYVNHGLKSRLRDNSIEDIRKELSHIVEKNTEKIPANKTAVYDQAMALNMSEDLIHYLVKPACLNAINEGLFIPQDLVDINHRTMRELIKPAALTAIRKGLFKVQDVVAIPHTFFATLMQPQYFSLIQDRLFLLSDVNGMNDDLFKYILQPESIAAMQENLFKLKEVATMDSHVFLYLCERAPLDRLRQKIYTIEDILHIQNATIFKLINHRTCLSALKEGHAKIEVLRDMDETTLRYAMKSNNYDPPSENFSI